MLSERTVRLLKNFASINPNIVIHPGNKLQTLSPSKTIYAECLVEETFEVEAGIYDLNELLSTLALLEDDYKVDWYDNRVEFVSNTIRLTHYYANKDVLVYPAKAIKFPDPDEQFFMSATKLAKVLKAATMLKTSDVSIVGDDKGIFVSVGDKKVNTSNKFLVRIDDNDSGRAFNAVFKVDNLKVIPGDYEIDLSSKMVSKWKTSDGNLTYYIALEHDSQF